MRFKSKTLSAMAVAAAACLISAGGYAQNIEYKSQAFNADTPLPFTRAGSAAPAPQPVTVVPAKTWEIKLSDINLANTLQRWASDAGWRFRWDARKNVMIEAPDTITGSFEDALKSILEAPGISDSAYPLEVCFYPNTPPLARITRKGEQDKECK